MLPCFLANFYFIQGSFDLHLFPRNYQHKTTVDFFFHFSYLRMSPERFEHLLQLTGHKLSKKDTRFRKAIPAAERLVLTLRFMASGDSQKSLSFAFRIGTTTIINIISETFIAIKEELGTKFLRLPRCPSHWLEISRDFEDFWDMPNVTGALDGKHIQIEAPANSGTFFHNFKGFLALSCLPFVMQTIALYS